MGKQLNHFTSNVFIAREEIWIRRTYIFYSEKFMYRYSAKAIHCIELVYLPYL